MNLIVDMGKSGIRMRRSSGATVEGPGVPPDVPGSPDGLAQVVEAVRQTAALFDPPVAPELVVIGSTALPDDTDTYARALHELWPTALLAVCDDGVLAHAAACGGFGIVASIGTGVVVTGLGENGLHRVDGWGPLLGDRGSAFDLGRRGLNAAFDCLDEVGPQTRLVELADEWLDGLGIPAAVRLHADPRRIETVASFAAQACLAAGEDDAVAARLVTDAAIEVAQSCRAVSQQCGQSIVAVQGGLTGSRAFVTALELALQRFELELVRAHHDVLEAPAELFFTDPYQKLVSCIIPPEAAQPGPDRALATQAVT